MELPKPILRIILEYDIESIYDVFRCSYETLIWYGEILRLRKKDFNINDIFTRFCERGELNKLRWFIQMLNLNKLDCFPGNTIDHLFRSMCNSRHLETAEYIHKYFNLSNEECLGITNSVFKDTCEHHNNISLAKWLRKEFNIKGIKYREMYINIFIEVCADDQIEIAKWIRKVEKLTREECLSAGNEAFIKACTNGHENTVKWLKDTFNITKEECFEDGYTFQQTCSNGHTSLAAWFKHEFVLTREECLKDDSVAFLYACENGKLETAKWLKEELKMTREECMKINNYAFGYTCIKGNLEVAKWLKEELKLTRDECFCNLYSINQIDSRKIIKWLEKEFSVDLSKRFKVVLTDMKKLPKEWIKK